MKCSACGNPVEGPSDALQLWDRWFCSTCFIGHAQGAGREVTPETAAMLRLLGREMAGLLPPSLIEMILVGFHKRATRSDAAPDKEELDRAVGEIQRLTAFSAFKQTLNLLKTWRDVFTEFADGQERDISEKVKRLTDLE